MNILSRLKSLLFRKIGATSNPKYAAPALECSSLILLCGPSYGDQHYKGSFLLDAVALKEWAIAVGRGVTSAQSLHYAAGAFIPQWLEKTSYQQDSYVTLLDKYTRGVLMSYVLDFYQKGLIRVYCHECHEHHDSIVINVNEEEHHGPLTEWTDEWLCCNGHVLHKEDQEIRWIYS